MARRTFFLLALVGVAAAGPLPAQATSLGPYRVVTLGLTDAEHTGSDGYQRGYAYLLNGSGQVAGSSQRFGGGSNEQGDSAWLYDSVSSTTTRLGYFDAGHTSSSGVQYSDVQFLTESGFAAGYSERYSTAAGNVGTTAWLYDSTSPTTTPLGFTDADHTGSDGSQYSWINDLNESGDAAGVSQRYAGTDQNGSSAWIYDRASATTTRIGFVDADHTRSDGYQSSWVNALNESDLAVGASERYAGPDPRGYSAWIHDSAAATTTRIGFTDAAHTASDGTQGSDVYYLNESGLAAGYSERYSGLDYMGRSAWLYDHSAGTTARVGLFDAAHTAVDGYQYSNVDYLSESGQAAGYSDHMDATGSPNGASAWIYDHASDTTTRVGFFDADHTGSDGYQISFVNALDDTGLAAGSSERWTGASYLGHSLWLYDSADTSTTRIGLFDAAHTASDGTQDGYVGYLTDSGFASGGSVRFDGSTYLGEDAWIYDSTTDSQYTITLSTRSDGYAFSYVSFLDESGLALGGYELYDSSDNDLGTHAFAWTASDGALDLGSLVAGGLSAAGWSRLADAFLADGPTLILGSGARANGNELPYLLQPVPEPGTLMLVAAGLGALALAGRRAADRAGGPARARR